MIQIAGVVVLATCLCLGVLIGISAANHHMRRVVHRNGQERREILEARAELAEQRAAFALQRHGRLESGPDTER